MKLHLGVPVQWELCYLFWKYMVLGHLVIQVLHAHYGIAQYTIITKPY